MVITGVNGGLGSYAPYYAPKAKEEAKAKGKNGGKPSGKETEEAKTDAAEPGKSTGGTGSKVRTAAEYTKYLQEKFSYMNKSTSMEGVPTTVSVSPAFIAKCANDPEKAKFLEENLNALPGCAKSGVAFAALHGSVVTNYSYSFDANGNISMTMSGTNDPDGKIAKENAERKAKETKEKKERAAEGRAAERAEEKKSEEKRAERKALAEKSEVHNAEGGFSRSFTVPYNSPLSLQTAVEQYLSAGADMGATGASAFYG